MTGRGVRTFGWLVMTALALLVAAYAAMVLFQPGFAPPFLAERRSMMPLAVIAHLSGGLVAMTVGPWQLNRRMREWSYPTHRWTGRVYVIAVTVGSLGALAMAPFSQFGPVSHVGFACLGVLWLATTLLAWREIRAGRRDVHREWMLRSYALTLAAVTLRIYLPLSIGFGLPFPAAYRAISWLCWVPNLLVAELVVRRGRRRPSMDSGVSRAAAA